MNDDKYSEAAHLSQEEFVGESDYNTELVCAICFHWDKANAIKRIIAFELYISLLLYLSEYETDFISFQAEYIQPKGV